MSDLSWTKELMESPDYRQRFFAEYWQTKIRYEKLKKLVTEIQAARIMKIEAPPHDVPEKILREQQAIMGEYLHILEIRAVIEDVDLEVTNLNIEGANDGK